MWLKNKQGSDWVRIKNKGMRRYICAQFAVYGAGGLLLIVALSLGAPQPFPLSYLIMGTLFAALCGGLAAWEKWKRGRF
jgi:hypothetical protein